MIRRNKNKGRNSHSSRDSRDSSSSKRAERDRDRDRDRDVHRDVLDGAGHLGSPKMLDLRMGRATSSDARDRDSEYKSSNGLGLGSAGSRHGVEDEDLVLESLEAALPGDRDRDLDRELMDAARDRRERDREREMDRDRTREMPVTPGVGTGLSGAGAGAGAGSRGGIAGFGDRRSSGRRSTTDSFVELFSEQVRH